MNRIAWVGVTITMLLAGVCAPAEVFATNAHRDAVAKNFMLKDCVLSCGLCHLDPRGSGPRNEWGERGKPGFNAVDNPTSMLLDDDFDGDEFSDREELLAGSHPFNRASTPETPEVLGICPEGQGPQYGCGARLARGTEDDGNMVAWLVIGFGAALGTSRKRRRR